MKVGIFVLLNGLFVFGATQMAQVPFTMAIAKGIQPLLAMSTVVQHWVG